VFAFFLTPALVISSAHAFPVADGIALLRQEMPANYCAVTFDDGPGPYTTALLDLLAQRGIVATFFVLGKNAERRPALIMRMLAEGHEVANHSYSHADMRRLKPEAQFLEMQKTRDALRSFGAEVRYFRPPYGRYTSETAAQAEALGMTLMLWSLDSQDWKRHAPRLDSLRSVSPAVQRSFQGLRGVFLFHDTHKHTVEEMADTLDALTAAGCERFVTVSEYMSSAPREEEHLLATQAPNEGRGEMPPPPLAGPLSASAADAAVPQPQDDAPLQRLSISGMRTQAAHAVQARKQDMGFAHIRTQPAHSGSGRRMSAAPEVLAVGVATNGDRGLAPPTAPQIRIGESPPAAFPLVRAIPAATPQVRASSAARGQIPWLLSTPDMVRPAHKPNKNKQDMRRGESDPG
jgi:peptidoglycan/xylan/chitin deacetylase (PgdA/CDA1 family)